MHRIIAVAEFVYQEADRSRDPSGATAMDAIFER
jgi:hypothetical protein